MPAQVLSGQRKQGFDLNKQILMLSAAALALTVGSARADDWTDITTALTVPVDTAHAASGDPGDIKLDTGGSITVALGGAAVTINSDNSFDAIAGTTISNKNTTDAVGILVDLSTASLDGTLCTADGCAKGITEAGTIELSGTGDTKRGLWLQGPTDTTLGPFAYTGDIDMTSSTLTITGDNSVGVQIDSLAQLDGNLTLGAMTINPTTATSTAGIIGLEVDGAVNGDINADAAITLTGNKSTSGKLIGFYLPGIVNGDVVFGASSILTVYGENAQGVLLTGSINAGGCDTSTPPVCTSLGALVNNGTITTVGQSVAATAQTGNPTAGPALALGGDISGGVYNAGHLLTGDSIATAVISAQSTGPAIYISPTLQSSATPTAITIGVYGGAGSETDPGFSFYNRGTVNASSSNFNQSASTIIIDGTSAADTTLSGGLFNSGTIGASAASLTAGSGVNATAITLRAYSVVGPSDVYLYDPTNSGCDCFVYQGSKTFTDDLHDEQASLVNSSATGTGRIVGTISGPMGGTANALVISSNAVLPSLINSGLISAVATTNDTSISVLSATAIEDFSGTLTYIQNNGAITASATTLIGGTQRTIAIDLSGDVGTTNAASGVMILNQATADTSAAINGDVLFGTGDHQIVDVVGATSDHLATINGNIAFGGGTTGGFGSDELNIGSFATVQGTVTAQNGVSVDVGNGGTFILTNNATALSAKNFLVESGGTLDLTVLEEFSSGIVTAKGSAMLDSGAKLNITYGSFIPADSEFVLITAPHGSLTVTDLDAYNVQLNNPTNLPFLFNSATLVPTTTPDGLTDELVLDVKPKTATELGLTGYAAQMLPLANQAMANDDVLGAAMVVGIVDQKSAQNAYDQFAPDVSGGTRAIAVTLTDQASGPVAARQRILRMYGKADGEITLWGQEFAEFITDPGKPSAGQTGFKDHGFGFVLGLDGGDPKTGWYGGAFSFYTGDIVEPLPRDSHANSLWYMLTGYTDWRGRGLFLDTKIDVGYVGITQKRFLDLTIPNSSGGSTHFVDEADSHLPGLVGAAGFTTGAILAYGSTTITPQFSLDGMTMREEGYTESHVGTTNGNGKGFDLQVASSYSNSLRAFIGTEIREDLNLGSFFVQPDIRLGYRYDFLNDPTKLTANFADVGTLSTPTPGPTFTVIGPDPAQGNFVAGASVSATTDAWTLGANFDFVRGTNGTTQEVGTLHLLGRI